MHERRRDGRVHASGQTADHASGADRVANLTDLVVDEGAGSPRRLCLADTEEKIRDQLTASRRVRDLGVKLYGEDRLLAMLNRSHRDGGTARRHDIPWRRHV